MPKTNKIFRTQALFRNSLLHFIVSSKIEQSHVEAMSLLLKSFTLFAIVNNVQMQQFFGKFSVCSIQIAIVFNSFFLFSISLFSQVVHHSVSIRI